MSAVPSSSASGTLAAGDRTLDRQRLGVVGFVLFVLAAWMLRHPYTGIAHDSVLYTFLALARLHPQLLQHDLFLRFGSQDQYTLFSPMYAQAISALGLERAAALLTLVCQAALYGCAWVFARRFMPAHLALIAIALLVALPLDYGAGRIFNVTETFLTPRLPAEALTLAGIAAALSSRRVLAGACLLAATLLHPILAAAGIAVLLCLLIGARYRSAAFLVGAGLVLVSGCVLFLRRGVLDRIDAEWLQIVRHTSPFLYVSAWSLRDWSRAAVPLTVLAVGLCASRDQLVRRMCAATLVTALTGVILSLIYCDLLDTALGSAAQPWRWLWMAAVTATVLAVPIAHECWRRGGAWRAVPLLIAAAAIVRGEPSALALAALGILCAAALVRYEGRAPARFILGAACALLLAAVAMYSLQGPSRSGLTPPGVAGGWIMGQWLRAQEGNGVWYAVALVALWLVCQRVRSLAAAACLVMGGGIICTALLLPASMAWTLASYPDSLRSQLAAWRRQIPPNAEVLWPVAPIGVWYLLERPSYWSLPQEAGDVFSRAKALEVHRRELLVADAMQVSGLMRGAPSSSTGTSAAITLAEQLDARGMARVCSDSQLAYYVSWTHLAPTPFAAITPNPRRPDTRLYLYDCASFRGAVGSNP
ncbi:MAG TPA: hypothetical protein VMD03_03965 [Steroidobacteraceae bacterium]|nr:hypothetical protein [Steroidobacteraceae bacterium]